MKNKKGILYLVSVPIGNDDDITLRALKVLKEVNLVVAEELKIVRKIFGIHKIKNEFFILNEHNEMTDAGYITEFLEKGENLALISDCGTPVFADPGTVLINECRRKNIEVKIVPGASSLMCALTGCGFNIKKFYFAGFLSKTQNERKEDLKRLNNDFCEPFVIMETPYRLNALLTDIDSIMPSRELSFIYKCTQPQEVIINGTAKKILTYVAENELKGEFIIVANRRALVSQTNKKNNLKTKSKKKPYKKRNK